MTWATTNLTTGSSLTALEREIISLSEFRTGSGNLTTSGSSTTVTLTSTGYGQISVGDKITANSLTRNVLAKTSDTLYTITIDVATNWNGYSWEYQTWSDKIIISKKIIGRELENYLSTSG